MAAVVVSTFSPEGLSSAWREGILKALRERGDPGAQVYVCVRKDCNWWGWKAQPHYASDGSSAKHRESMVIELAMVDEITYTTISSPSQAML